MLRRRPAMTRLAGNANTNAALRGLSIWPFNKKATTPTPTVDYPDEVPPSWVDPVAATQQKAELAAFSSAIDGPGRAPSMLERMDSSWTSLFESFGIPRFGFIDGGVAWLETIQAVTGVPWSVLVLGFGFLLRLMTLPLSLYGERATVRLAAATDEVRPQFDAFQAAYRSPGTPKKEIARLAEEMRAARKAAFVRHGTSNRATMVSLLGSPMIMWGFSVVQRLLNEGSAIKHDSGIAWLFGVGLPDPCFVVPVVALLFSLANFEIVFARRRASSPAKSSGMLTAIPVVVRLMAIASLPVVMSLRSGTALYWLGMSAAGLLQPLILSSKAFCDWFGIVRVTPAPLNVVQGTVSVVMGDDTNEPKPADALDARIQQAFPKLSVVLTPEEVSEADTSKTAVRGGAGAATRSPGEPRR